MTIRMYDGENKMGRYDALDAQTNPTYYLYDADGKRKQAVDSKTARYIHGLGGELLAEGSATGITKEYAYRNGDLLVTAKEPKAGQVSDVRWLVKDHLGTPRIVADGSGTLAGVKRHDYLPFGEEIGPTSFGRSTAQGYGNPQSDGVRQQFTGYERDDESGLDFAEARMFGSSLGRFSSPDPYNVILEMQGAKDADEREEVFISFASNPQRWNAYAYVLNNPLAFVDPEGLNPETINVIVGLADKNGMKEWEKFAKEARDKGFTVNIYTVDGGKATAARFIDSLKSKDTVTIFSGHSWSNPRDERVGIQLNGSHIGNSQAQRQNKVSHTADGVDIKNDIVAVFSCGFGKGFDNLTSSTKTAFVSIVQGDDPGTMIDSVNRAALDFAKSISTLSRASPLTPDFNLSRATARSQGAMTVFGYAAQNDKDKVSYRYLPRRK